MRALVVFAVMFATDWLSAFYFRHASQGHVWRSSLAATALVLTGSLATIAYVDDHRMIVPACLGAFAGTFIGLRTTTSKP